MTLDLLMRRLRERLAPLAERLAHALGAVLSGPAPKERLRCAIPVRSTDAMRRCQDFRRHPDHRRGMR